MTCTCAKAMDMNDPCLQADGPCTVRLHVGGLGPSVISSDLVQIFSSLAKVSCVDLVHTKGRDFAYVTIQAASRDIKRLFSLYNGCMWKGGRLKLEKAREFYLDKLHREWADRDCFQAIQTPKLDCTTTARSLMKSKDSNGFKIYIPKLRKVKTIPEKGLGKHKRSFERVDPLPHSLLQVCNCDQHCTTTSQFQTRTRRERSGPKNAAIKTSTNETSMDYEHIFKASGYKDRKRFEKKPGVYLKNGDGQDNSKNGDGQDNNGVPALDEPVLNIKGGVPHSEKGDTEHMTDIDEPVLNVTGFNDFCFGKTKESMKKEVLAVTKEQTRACIEKAPQVVGGVQRKRLKSDVDTWASNRKKHLGEMRKVTDLTFEGGETNESKAGENVPGRSWVQKASWKSLVGETGRMSFSLGSMLDQSLVGNPESTSKELVKPTICEELSLSTLINGPSTLTRSNFDNHASSLVQNGEERIVQISEGPRPCSNKGNELKRMVKEEKLLSSNGDDRGFTFVKSRASEQDWLESKQVVKRIVKRSHKNGLKTLKGLHTKPKH